MAVFLSCLWGTRKVVYVWLLLGCSFKMGRAHLSQLWWQKTSEWDNSEAKMNFKGRRWRTTCKMALSLADSPCTTLLSSFGRFISVREAVSWHLESQFYAEKQKYIYFMRCYSIGGLLPKSYPHWSLQCGLVLSFPQERVLWIRARTRGEKWERG